MARPRTIEYVDVEYVEQRVSAEMHAYSVKIVKSLHLRRSAPLLANSVPLFWDKLNGSDLLDRRNCISFRNYFFC